MALINLGIIVLCFLKAAYCELDFFKEWQTKKDELRPSTNKLPSFLPTAHPNSVLPYGPEDLDYEEYVYEEYEENKGNKATTRLLPVFTSGSTTAKPVLVLPKSNKNTKPQFIEDPQNAYIIRGQPAVLRCKVIHADKAYFTCNGEAMAASDLHKEVDKVEISETATMEPYNVKTLTLQLNRINIEEFFGLYTCRCDAWSAKGMTSSRNATVEFAFIRKEFEVPPYSQSVELGSQIQLRCHPPKGVPKPRIYWMKDRVEVLPERDSNYIQAADGHLIIIQAREKDRANYTCVAENVANRRLSPPARLNVHVSGGWSPWSEWTECSSKCGQGFQRRDRRCDNPTPRWGGPMCEGSHVDRTKCTSSICPDGMTPTKLMSENEAVPEGTWSLWSPWTACSGECVKHRRRTCNADTFSLQAICPGDDREAASCSGDFCTREQREISADEAHEMVEKDFSLLIGLSVALTVFLVVSLTSIRILRRKGRSPSMYTMTNLNYRREFSDKKANHQDHQTAADSLLEINTNMNKETHFTASIHNRSTIDILKGTGEPRTPKLMHYDSAIPSPFLDKKLQPNTPLLKPRALSPSNSEEHQYDIPFSHLKRSHQTSFEEVNNRQRKSRTSQRTSSGTSSNSKWPKSHEGSLLQPRLIDGNTGATPLLPRRWSGSESSFNSDHMENIHQPIVSSSMNQSASYRQSLNSCTLDPDSFTFASVTSAGCTLTLADLGVTLTIPEGALEKGFTEEVFLAVLTEGRDRPRLSDNQTLLSPVVLAGPPRLTFKKPVVLSFGHCALATNTWEMGVYHCDSLFSDADDTPWVKLTTVGLQQDSQVLAHVENDSCHVMTDYLSRFCLVGQSASNQLGAIKGLYLLIFGKPMSSSSLDFCVSVQVTDRTPSALETALRQAERQGFGLLETPHILHFYDFGPGSDLLVTLSDCVAGWALRSSKNFTLSFFNVWSSGQTQVASYTLEHVDPTVQIIAFKVTLMQQQTNSAQQFSEVVFNIQVDTNARLVNPLASKKRWKVQNGLLTTNSSGSTSTHSSDNHNHFKLPAGLKIRLCRGLDQAPNKSLNDWRALAAALRLETGYFQSRSSPTECILTLWEVQQQQASYANNDSSVNPLVDLLNLLRVIGRQDAALMVEKDFGPWI